MVSISNDGQQPTNGNHQNGVILASTNGMENKTRFLILYASQTGNALDAAERVGREAEHRGCPSVVLSMDEFDASSLPYEGTVIFIVSTTGQGDTPDSMKVFWKFLLQRTLSQQWLKGVHYAVFGLGDSGYQKFNKLDKRLSDLGAEPLIERGLGDDQHPSGYEGALDDWLSSLWKVLKKNPNILLREIYVDPAAETLDRPKYKVIYHDADSVQSEFVTAPELESIELQIERARSMCPGKFGRNKHRPHCFLQMV
ncbi:Nadph-dependent diflavin oxidoreductase [Thalictrum thalictroides]|uniref:Nadph-dependent diflavin oxidoreductase n=1 Tax=Thalictrum thalictroides TaxID=46969 RepID=A0A7J6V1L4_THATH|nr:Nadph-dependent diflavin oxidoreductase [Thalictrum thalictroides]